MSLQPHDPGIPPKCPICGQIPGNHLVTCPNR